MTDATHEPTDPPPDPDVPGAGDDVPQNAGRLTDDAVNELEERQADDELDDEPAERERVNENEPQE